MQSDPSRVLLRHGSSILATSLAMMLLNTATGVILARLLGPSGRGHLAAAILWPNLVIAVGSLGLSESVVFFSARMPDKERIVSATGFVVALFQSLILGGMWYFVAPAVLGHYGHETVLASQYVVLAFPLSLLPMVTTGMLLGRLDVRSYNFQRLGGIALTVVGLSVLYVLQISSLVAIVVVYLVVGGLVLAYTLVILMRRNWLGFRASQVLLRKLLSYGVRSHLGTVSGIANDRADQTLISIVLSPFYLGLYTVALTLPAGVVLIGNALATIALPTVTAVGSEVEMRRTFAPLVRITVVLSIVAASVLVFATPTVIRIFFGPAFLPAAPVAQLLILASIFISINRVTSAGLRAFNRPLQAGTGDLLAAIVTLLSLALLVPKVGLMGAAIASLLAYLANLAYNVWTCSRLGIPARELLVPKPSDLQYIGTTLKRVASRR